MLPSPALLGFEWRYQTRRTVFFAIATSFALFGFALAATGFGPDAVAVNAAASIAQSVGLASLLAVIVAAYFAAQAGLRDSEHGMSELVLASGLERRTFLASRYVGCALGLVAAFACLVPGLLAGTFAVAHEPARLAPFALAPYLEAFIVIAVPNALFLAALLLAVALGTRSSLATYVSGVLLYVLYFATALLTGSPLLAGTRPPNEQTMVLAGLLDPFGISAFFAAIRTWTPAEQAVGSLATSGVLLSNRLLWLGVTAALLVWLDRTVTLRLPQPRSGRRVDLGAPEPAAAAELAPLAPRQGLAVTLRAFAAASRFELRCALRGWPLLALSIGWVGLLAVELGQTFRHAELGTALLPTSALLLPELDAALGLFGTLVVLYFAAELVSRERAAGMHEVVGATPVPSGALLAAKLVALLGVVCGLIGLAAGTGIAFQLASGWRELEPLRLASLLVTVGLPLGLVALLAVLVQSVVTNRYLGLVLTAGAILVWHRGALGGPAHPLLRYAGLPSVPFSEMAGFGPERHAFAGFGAYWLAFGLLLVGLAVPLWPRGTASLRERLGGYRKAWSRPARWLTAVAGLAWLGLGAGLGRELVRTGEAPSPKAIERWKADYERRYQPLREAAQPVPVAVEVTIELEPAARRYHVEGRYRLENRSAQAIDTVWASVRRDLAWARLELDGRPPEEVDARFATRRFRLPQPLAPGGTAELRFALAVERGPLATGAAARDIVGNGSFQLSHVLLPTLGYRASWELEDEAARRRHGLPPRVRTSTHESADALALTAGVPVPFTFEATITTDVDQLAVAPGRLVEDQLVEHPRLGVRRRLRYRSDGPISPLVAFASGRYAVARREVAGVTLEVLHHPAHERNVPAMLDALERSLRWCARHYGPYPHRELRLVEVPSSSPLGAQGSGFAVPGVIFLLERSGFLTDRSDPTRIDVVTKRIAHEVAHQWWGHLVSPAPAPGASALVESLARYTELRVLAEVHGEEAVAPVLAHELDRYLTGRADAHDVPLGRVENQGFVSYSKGALVFSALRERLGEGALHRALARLLEPARAGHQPGAPDALAALLAEAPATEHGWIERAWNGIVLDELRLTGARGIERAGRLTVELGVQARRLDESGPAPAPFPFQDEVEVAFYEEEPGVQGRGPTPLAVHRRTVTGNTTTHHEVDPRARWVLLDPHLHHLERLRADNLRRIEIAAD